MRFASPHLLLGLIGVPVAVIAYLAIERLRAKRAQGWTRPALLPNILWRQSGRRSYLPASLFLVALTLLLVGFARPQLRAFNNTTGGAPTIVLTFDLSGSMAANDVGQSRIRAARKVAIQFLGNLPSKYMVAVMTFGDRVRLTVAPTRDRKKVIAHLPNAVTPRAGTSLGDAISASVAFLIRGVRTDEPVDRLHPPGAVVMFSDGTQTAGGTSPADATASAFVYAIPIDTISVGTPHGIVTQLLNVAGFHTPVKTSVPASPATLQQVASRTGGTFVNVTSAAELATAAGKAATAYETRDLRPLARSTQKRRELSAVAGGLALLFIVGGIVSSGVWFGRLA